MTVKVVKYDKAYLVDAIAIWNEVVDDGLAFPQEEFLTEESGDIFFCDQTYTGIALDDGNNVVGLYILHPNNIGRCGHICNASYAVAKSQRGNGVGEVLVRDCIDKAGDFDFSILQFNAVVADNYPALSLYEKIGFIRLGVIPKGFRSKDGTYKDIVPHYINVKG